MQQFVVPQFIEVEDKIFGPITTRQFLILLATGLVLFIIFKLADPELFIFACFVLGGSSAVLAFVRVNGQAFHYFILNIIQTVRRPSLRIWNKFHNNKDLDEFIHREHVVVAEKAVVIPKVSYNRIRDLSLIVNTGGYYKP